MRASAPMEQEREIDSLRYPCPVELLITIESGFIKAYNGRLHDALLYLLYGGCGILLGLVNPVHKRALTDVQTEHFLEEILYTTVGQEHHNAQIDNQRLDGGVIYHGIGAALAGSMRLDALAALLADRDVVADFLYDRLQVGNGNDLCHIVQYAFAVFQRGTAFGAVVGRHVFRLVRRLCHLQGTALMSLLSARLPACRLAKSLGTAYGLVLHAFL